MRIFSPLLGLCRGSLGLLLWELWQSSPWKVVLELVKVVMVNVRAWHCLTIFIKFQNIADSVEWRRPLVWQQRARCSCWDQISINHLNIWPTFLIFQYLTTFFNICMFHVFLWFLGEHWKRHKPRQVHGEHLGIDPVKRNVNLEIFKNTKLINPNCMRSAISTWECQKNPIILTSSPTTHRTGAFHLLHSHVETQWKIFSF